MTSKGQESTLKKVKAKLRTELYPALEPYNSGLLKVSDLHQVYYEECGNPKGIPVFFVHGGPGGGIVPLYRQFFDPKFYRIVLFDQRGCGKSLPYASLQENTTWDLVEDMEKIRKKLKIKKFLLFGGSWGSTLSLAYATQYPKNLLGMILRGIFLCRPMELHWFYEEGASYIFPEIWENYLLPLSQNEQKKKIHSYYKKLTGKDKKLSLEAARAWSIWEGSTSKLVPELKHIHHYGDPHFALAFARIECHYFYHKAFFKTDNYLLEQAKKYQHLPGIIIQGRYDMVCPMKSAWDLHQAWQKAEFIILDRSGHSCTEKDMIKELVKACEKFKNILK